MPELLEGSDGGSGPEAGEAEGCGRRELPFPLVIRPTASFDAASRRSGAHRRYRSVPNQAVSRLPLKSVENGTIMLHKTAIYEGPLETLHNSVVIHEYAIVRRGAVLGRDVVIHPFVVIGAGVTLGDGVEVFPGAVIGKEPKGAGATARSEGFERTVTVGANSSIGPHAVIFYDVTIGRNTLIGDGASIRERCRVGDFCIISRYVTLNYNATVGNRSKIMDLSHITGNCTVGDDVFVSIHVSTTNDNRMGKRGYQEEDIVGPRIEDGALIGAGASILPGVRIGKSAVVGSGAVVTKDVPAGTVVMGIPAKALR